MGIMNVHAVSGKRPYRTSSASRGVDRWLNIQKHSSIAECAEHLKAKGFLLAAGFPEDDAIPLSKLPIEKPIALVFGNEHDGVSKDWVPHLDFRFTIPMSGMVESMNISVSAAISLYEVRRRHLQSRPPSIDHSQTAATAGTWANEHFARLRSKDYSP
jgi:tRNA (guanosine-2'-O-)-methyltransferase